MNKDWDTPPGGDFVAYVERLTARSAQAVRSPVEQLPADFGRDHDDETGVAQPATMRPAVRALAPGEIPPEKPFTNGLTAVLGSLRDSLERSARNAQQRKKS